MGAYPGFAPIGDVCTWSSSNAPHEIGERVEAGEVMVFGTVNMFALGVDPFDKRSDGGSAYARAALGDAVVGSAFDLEVDRARRIVVVVSKPEFDAIAVSVEGRAVESEVVRIEIDAVDVIRTIALRGAKGVQVQVSGDKVPNVGGLLRAYPEFEFESLSHELVVFSRDTTEAGPGGCHFVLRPMSVSLRTGISVKPGGLAIQVGRSRGFLEQGWCFRGWRRRALGARWQKQERRPVRTRPTPKVCTLPPDQESSFSLASAGTSTVVVPTSVSSVVVVRSMFRSSPFRPVKDISMCS